MPTMLFIKKLNVELAENLHRFWTMLSVEFGQVKDHQEERRASGLAWWKPVLMTNQPGNWVAV
jgi:hypothetical protein